MPRIALPIAAHFLTGSILTLAMPLGVLIAIVVWYVLIWRRDARER
jgi:hypothetical protein